MPYGKPKGKATKPAVSQPRNLRRIAATTVAAAVDPATLTAPENVSENSGDTEDTDTEGEESDDPGGEERVKKVSASRTKYTNPVRRVDAEQSETLAGFETYMENKENNVRKRKGKDVAQFLPRPQSDTYWTEADEAALVIKWEAQKNE